MTSIASPFQCRVTLSLKVTIGSASDGNGVAEKLAPACRFSSRRLRTFACATIAESAPKPALPPA